MEGHSIVSAEILGSYAADAAREVAGVRSVVDGPLRKSGAKVADADGRVSVELHLALEWGASVPSVGREVQERVVAYLGRMADVTPETVDVIVDEIGPPPAPAG